MVIRAVAEFMVIRAVAEFMVTCATFYSIETLMAFTRHMCFLLDNLTINSATALTTSHNTEGLHQANGFSSRQPTDAL
jgi:hypothetical protein